MRGRILLTGIILSVFTFCKEKEKNLKKEEVIPVTITIPQKRDILKEIIFTAEIEGNPDIYVYPEIPGYFLKYTVKEGEKVEKDGIIAYIERKIPGMEYNPIPVKSPISGYVSELLRKNGEFVTQSKPIARVARYDELFAVLSLPGKYAGKLEEGEKVKVMLNEKELEGVLKWISKTLDPFTKTLKVKVLFKNPGGIYPGMLCEVKIPVEKKKSVTSLEKDAILGDIVKYVFVKNGERVNKKIVETGIENDKYVEILSGLKEQDTIILRGNRILKEGMKIEVKEE
ncbi:MAG: efflux RND transporter periplasmic adaptor subunit [candidate division WOR-3 bacterium]|uniref:Efflux RND transporter periplasmic adaptor subunit n=1 Tax=candidate division WOR-3 bacterium TaxID=2052148 RepID=A0A7V4ABE3_UNCW3